VPDWDRSSRNENYLPALLDDQDHPGTEDCDVAVVAFEGRDSRLVAGRDGVEGFPGLDPVVNHARRAAGRIFVALRELCVSGASG